MLLLLILAWMKICHCMDLHRYRGIWNDLALVEMAEQLYLDYEPYLRVSATSFEKVVSPHDFNPRY